MKGFVLKSFAQKGAPQCKALALQPLSHAARTTNNSGSFVLYVCSCEADFSPTRQDLLDTGATAKHPSYLSPFHGVGHTSADCFADCFNAAATSANKE